jgi:hypothetical protein
MHLSDEMSQHRFGHLKIGNDPIFQRTNGNNVSRCPSQHPLGFRPYREDSVLVPVIGANSYNRWFAKHYPLPLDIHKRIGSAQINGQIVGNGPKE